MGLGCGRNSRLCSPCAGNARSVSKARGGLEDTTSGVSSSEFESELILSCCSAAIRGRRVDAAWGVVRDDGS